MENASVETAFSNLLLDVGEESRKFQGIDVRGVCGGRAPPLGLEASDTVEGEGSAIRFIGMITDVNCDHMEGSQMVSMFTMCPGS